MASRLKQILLMAMFILMLCVAGCGGTIGVEIVDSSTPAAGATEDLTTADGMVATATPASVRPTAAPTTVHTRAPTETSMPTKRPTPTPEGSLTLSQALAQGLVDAQFRGTGSAAGDSIIATLTRKVPRTLEITIPKGTVLASNDSTAQDMVVLRVRGIPVGGDRFEPASSIRLTSDESKEFVLEAYCLDFDRDNPSGSTGFSVGEPASSDVQAILQALQKVPLSQRSIGAIQTAIWTVTDDLCERELQARFQVSAADLEAAEGILEAAGINPATTCLFGGRSAEPPTIKPSAQPTPTVAPETGLTATPTSILSSASTPTHQIGMPVVGQIWQVAVASVSRMNRLQCGLGTDRSTHWIEEGYELLEVTVEFAPVKREEEMSVTTENAVLIDSEGEVKEAVGGGHPTEEAVMGRRSDNCGLGGSGRVVVVESFLVRDTLTTSFFFVVDEGSTGYSFQYLGYPPITLD